MAAKSQDDLKKEAAWKAVDYIKSDMVVGLGTGSTAAFAVDRLGQLLKDGTLKNIIGVPTSVRTYEQALALGIPLATLDEQPHIHVAIDGAGESPSLHAGSSASHHSHACPPQACTVEGMHSGASHAQAPCLSSLQHRLTRLQTRWTPT